MYQFPSTAGPRGPRLPLAVAGCVLAGSLAACSGPAPATDRSGGDTVTLHLATSDGEGVDPTTNQGPEEFVTALEEVSGGRLKVDLSYDYGAGAGDAETQLVEAIAQGKVDGGWPATRAFARAGIEGLEGIEAPMVLTSEAAIEELVTGPPADTVLGQLTGTGLTGVGLMAAPLRRPVSGNAPLVTVEDWDGATFRVYNSPVQAATVRALGGRPENMTHAWVDAIRLGDLDGAEADVVTQDLPTSVGHITGNVVLWPKVFVTTFNQNTFDGLTDQQRDWVREASDRATRASVAAPYDASADLQGYCDRGTKVHAATTAQLAALRTRVDPVRDDLRQNPETSAVTRAIESLAAKYPGTDVPPPAGGCDDDDAETGGLPTTAPPLPNGTYRTEIPVAATADVGNGDGWSGLWTLKVANGKFALTCRPIDVPNTDCGHVVTDDALEAGYLRGDESTMWFIGNAKELARLSGCELPPSEDDPDACFVVPPYSASWTLDGDELTFADSAYLHLTLAPWRRIS